MKNAVSEISKEIKEQLLEKEGKLPTAVIACVGGGSNSIGSFYNFIDDKEVRLIGCGALCGVLAALLQGMTDYIWYNYRVYFIFWFVLALTSAYIRVGRSELNRDNANLAAQADMTRATLDLPLNMR